MKTAIYIEDGLTQFVLTPEDEIDKRVLKELQSTNLKTYRGSFYGCRGGWTRWDEPKTWDYSMQEREDQSLIFVITKVEPIPPASVIEPVQVASMDAYNRGFCDGEESMRQKLSGKYGSPA